MSLIIDALEKVQKETRTPIATADWLVTNRPKPAVPVLLPKESFRAEEKPAAVQSSQRGIVILCAVMLIALAGFGFKIIASGLSLPLVQDSGFSLGSAGMNSSKVPAAEPLILRGILQDPKGSFCILGDQILKLGNTWRGYTVVSIEEQHVVVRDAQNHLLTLQLQESS